MNAQIGIPGVVSATRRPLSYRRRGHAMRVLVTGSRDWCDPQEITEALWELIDWVNPLIIMHGDCPSGADRVAREWVVGCRIGGMTDVSQEWYRADWRKHGRRAGILRNLEMIAQKPDLCLAFIRNDSPGATHCANAAIKAGIETRIWETA